MIDEESESASEQTPTSTNVAVRVRCAGGGRLRSFGLDGFGRSLSDVNGCLGCRSIGLSDIGLCCRSSSNGWLGRRRGKCAVRGDEFDSEVRAVLEGDFFHPEDLCLFDTLVVAKLFDEGNGVVNLVSLVVTRASVCASINDHVRHVGFLPRCRLQRTRPAEAPSIPDLVTFHHPSARIVQPSDIVEAGHRGDLETIQGAIGAETAAVRSAAMGALLRLDALEIEQWQRFATDPDATVRRRAAELAPRLPMPMLTEESLVQLLDDTDEIAEVASFALGEVGSMSDQVLSEASIERLERVVRDHSDALCREAAVAALGALHSGLPTILHACADKATVRRRAIIALAPFDGPEVEAALTHALDDRDWQVRQAAEDLLTPPPSDDKDA